MSTKRGRKPLHEDKRDKRLTVSFTAAELDALERDAAHLARPAAEYVRDRFYGHTLVIVPPANKDAWVLLADLREMLKPLLREIELRGERGLLAPRLILGVVPLIDRLQEGLISAATVMDQDKATFESIDSGLGSQ